MKRNAQSGALKNGARGTVMVLSVASALFAGACGGKPAPPPSAAQVARMVGLTGFVGCGPAPLGGVTDSGVGYRAGVRIGINTFPDAGVRDEWLKVARHFGIVPFREASNWVAYRATDQATKGCGD